MSHGDTIRWHENKTVISHQNKMILKLEEN